MADLDIDTAVVRQADGRYRATLSKDWEIWGPMGGYVAAVALRAIGAEARLARPASFFCHYLGVAAFDEVDIEVTCLRRGRNAESFRAVMTQGDQRIMEATLWTIGAVDGLVHDVLDAPVVPDPEGLRTLDEMTDVPFAFWDNIDARPVEWREDWPPPRPMAPIFREWMRFRPSATFADPWLDAARYLIVLDVQSWPSAVLQHAWKWPAEAPEFMAPTLDLYVAFHDLAPGEPWLLADGFSSFAQDGLIGWTGRVWSHARRLVVSGGGQMLCRRLQTNHARS